MRMKFYLDGCYTLTIGGDLPRIKHDPRSVGIQIDHTPLPEPTLAYSGSSEGPSVTHAVMSRPEPQCVASFNMKPSHARAIASALLSAATEAK